MALADGRPEDAQRHIEKCLRIWPNDAAVHLRAARAARQTADFAGAEKHLNECLRIEKGASEATQLEFLLMRAQTGEIDEVAGLLFAYVDQGHPESALILETAALVYLHNFRYGPAFTTLKRWIDEAAGGAKALHFRGWVLERMNQPKLALDDYLRALELNPRLDKVRLRVAEMYLEDKEALSALPHLEYLQATDPNNSEMQARLGQCRYLQGQHTEARHLLEAAHQKLPNDVNVLLYLARLDIYDKQPKRGEERLRAALAVDPANTEIRFTLVSALQLQRREKEALAELAEHDRQRALLERTNHLLQEEAKHPSRDPAVASEIGQLLLQIQQVRQGVHWLEEALARDPNHRPAHQALAEFFEQKGDHERAAYHRVRTQR